MSTKRKPKAAPPSVTGMYQYWIDFLPGTSSKEDLVARLNALGALGWELLFVGDVDVDGSRAAWFIGDDQAQVPSPPPPPPPPGEGEP